jgi:D-glycero-D-manno-heptose 1,7-bisphosphate phosphatase
LTYNSNISFLIENPECQLLQTISFPTSSLASRPVVFLDRDGTLNVEAGYIKEVENLNLIEGAGEAIAKLNQAGVACVLVTNQTGAARGYYPESHINALHERLVKLLALSGAHLDAIYYCPHLSRAEGGCRATLRHCLCNCRKPGPGLS